MSWQTSQIVLVRGEKTGSDYYAWHAGNDWSNSVFIQEKLRVLLRLQHGIYHPETSQFKRLVHEVAVEMQNKKYRRRDVYCYM